MASKTIKVSEENYEWLIGLAAQLQEKRKKRVTFDDALNELQGKKKKEDIMDFAGDWDDISDKEAKQFLDGVYKERKVISRRLK
jgi:predicted CopG family antitoxin